MRIKANEWLSTFICSLNNPHSVERFSYTAEVEVMMTLLEWSKTNYKKLT